MSREFKFMLRESKPGPQLIRITLDDGEISRQHILTPDGWESWRYMDWTGIGGAADWSPISQAEALAYLPSGVGAGDGL